MARVHPFRAWRYSPSPVHLQDGDTQPYDRIYPVIEQAYHRRNSFNLVRILLELPEFFDAKPRESVYCRAAHDFPAGHEKGVLVGEKDPCIFADANRFTPPGADRVNRSRGLTADIAFIARPVPLEQRKQVTFACDVLRPKSTDFFPQPMSGVAIYALD
jgi:uncharacterized protein (DUF1015 family)